LRDQGIGQHPQPQPGGQQQADFGGRQAARLQENRPERRHYPDHGKHRAEIERKAPSLKSCYAHDCCLTYAVASPAAEM
jgi:hypothetical protein